jgi:ribosomal protein S18 acetylase RimI-like enzyme
MVTIYQYVGAIDGAIDSVVAPPKIAPDKSPHPPQSHPLEQSNHPLQASAIHPDRQGQGRGKQLLREVEQVVTQRSGRVLLVETSGMPDFDRVRSFYDHCGYEAEARIRDFYKAGDDKIVYRKALTA